jgi:hypothetical protein
MIMRQIQATWFECKVRYEKVMENGLQKKVTEQYVVDALSFSEAEKRIIEEMSAYISGEFEITDVKKAQYKEVFFSNADLEDRYYKAKLAFITIDEKTEKEKRSAVTYLVQAGTLDGAVKNINEVMDGTMIDYEKSNIAETKIIDVFEYAQDKAADLMGRMAEELKDRSKTVEEIADKYVKTATPELRQQLIDRLNQMRQSGQVPEKE